MNYSLLFLLNCYSSILTQIINTRYYGKITPFSSRIDLKKIKEKYLITTMDLKSNFTWFRDVRHECFDNKEIKITINKIELVAIECIDSLTLTDDNKVLSEYYYYIIPKQSSPIYKLKRNSLAFSYKFNDEKFSVIHQLYNEKKISKKIFAIGEYDKFNDYGEIYFGGIPDEIIVNKTFKGKCNVDDSYSTWSCSLKKIEINHHTYHATNHYMYFQTNNEYIYAPQNFMSFIFESLDNNLKKDCYVYKSSFGGEHLRCLNDILDNLPNYTFIFDSTSFSIPIKDFFEPGYETSDSILFFSSIENDRNDTWIFGNYFLSRYITVFDYEDKSISFYSNKYTIALLNEFNIKKYFIISIMGILSLSILYIFIVKVNMK